MRFCSSSLFGKVAAGLVAWALAFFACHYAVSLSTPALIEFKDAMEFKDFAVRNGLHFHSGNQSDIMRDTLFVADRPLTIADFDDLYSRLNCGLTPAWHGILWVCEIHNSRQTLFPDSVGGNWRVWGNILVAGDEKLMDKIEALYRTK